MARVLYRLLRVFNVISSFDEAMFRRAMSNNAAKNELIRIIDADLSKPLSYMLPLTGRAMSPTLNANANTNANSGKKTRDRVSAGE